MRHLIVGGGPAGMSAIETLRALDPGCEIALVCDEPPCARMVLPYYLAGKIEEQAVLTADDAWLRELGVEVHLGRRASGLYPGAARLSLDDGSQLAYDRLLLATGSSAARLDGIHGDGIAPMWRTEDARGFLEAGEGGETVVVGAGFIAFTVLDALCKRSERVTILEIEPQILPNMLDGEAAELVLAQLTERGVEVRTGTRLVGVDQAAGRRRLHVDSVPSGNGSSGQGSQTLDADRVVVAAGVRPNVGFLDGSGVALGEGAGAGVLVDAGLRTSVAAVFAAGDLAQGPDLLTGEQRVHAIQPTAVDHGRVAAAGMAGVDAAYAGSLVMNVLAVQGIEAASFGRWNEPGLESTVVSNPRDRIYRKYVWDGDRLVGGMLVGPTSAVTGLSDVGMLKGLVQTGAALGSWRGYLEENPLDLRRPFLAIGTAKELLGQTLLTGRASPGGGFRFPKLAARRKRSAHHAVLVKGAPR